VTGSTQSARPVEEISYRWLFWMLAVAVAATTIWVIWDEAVTRRPWKEYQERFNTLLESRGERAEAIEIRQVTNPDLGIVDRCESCHLGIDRAGLESDDIPAVFRTHPRRDILLGKNHPVRRFGCTICHRGQGSQTKGVRGAKFDHGRNDPYWDTPMATGVFAESSCVTCHDPASPVAGADTYNRGRQLFEDLSCTGCHATPLVVPPSAVAMPMDHLRTKTSQAFVVEWLRDPRRFRPDTRMPIFWPEPLDPESGRPLENGPGREKWRLARDREVAALTAFLASLEPRTPWPVLERPPALEGDPIATGKKLFDEVGCRGCHSPEPSDGLPSTRTVGASFAPNLSRAAEKISAEWLAAWLAEPRAVWPEARMPSLDLSPEEQAALLAFSLSLREPGATPLAAEWQPASAALIAAGRAAVEKYGCFGCHDIPGFERAGRVGADLDDFGDKPADQLAWGDTAIECERTPLECWTVAKLRHPLRFQGRDLISLMPGSALSDEDALALAVFSLAHRKREVSAAYVPPVADTARALQRGEAVLYRENCRGCHEIGRAEKRVVDEDGDLVEIEYTPNGATTLPFYEHAALAPPPLTFAGMKFQLHWLYDFLAEPTRLRPWLVARMPTYALTDDDLIRVVEHFAARNQEPFPYKRRTWKELNAADHATASSMFEKLQCTKCHELSSAAKLTVGDLAPDLALAATRLDYDWQVEWLLDPQRLQPGTKMPAYFPLEDEDEPGSYTTPCPDCLGGDVQKQVDALVKLTMELGTATAPKRTAADPPAASQ